MLPISSALCSSDFLFLPTSLFFLCLFFLQPTHPHPSQDGLAFCSSIVYTLCIDRIFEWLVYSVVAAQHSYTHTASTPASADISSAYHSVWNIGSTKYIFIGEIIMISFPLPYFFSSFFLLADLLNLFQYTFIEHLLCVTGNGLGAEEVDGTFLALKEFASPRINLAGKWTGGTLCVTQGREDATRTWGEEESPVLPEIRENLLPTPSPFPFFSSVLSVHSRYPSSKTR